MAPKLTKEQKSLNKAASVARAYATGLKKIHTPQFKTYRIDRLVSVVHGGRSGYIPRHTK